ncbi:MAG: non-canonical purine NTP pyrophosphatase, partial [Proteobacteria bacterium]|nr:non-canonical purine NTP pyrophosphatase [Pseudomonadota bacterium]
MPLPIVHKPLFVDDVGFFVEAWNGFPGPFVKYLCEVAGNEGLLRMMKDETNRQVTVKAVI